MYKSVSCFFVKSKIYLWKYKKDLVLKNLNKMISTIFDDLEPFIERVTAVETCLEGLSQFISAWNQKQEIDLYS